MGQECKYAVLTKFPTFAINNGIKQEGVMINTFALEGTLVDISPVKETERGSRFATMTLEVERAFRNSDGIYESDLIQVDLWRGVADLCTAHCKAGDIIGVQGRIQSSQLTSGEGKKFIAYNIIAEKVSLLSLRIKA